MDPVDYNRSAWDRLARAGDRFYRAVTPEEIEAARRGDFRIRVTPTKAVPADWLQPLADQEILCLAGGGARQGPLLAAAGARVTVYDLSPSQLQRDREVAQREGLELATVAGDMRDLSAFADRSFDRILSPCATCFCPEVQPVWNEAFRVLRPGGSLIVGWINPVHYLFDAVQMERGRLQVAHRIPYSDLELPEETRAALLGPERPLEFGHSLEDLLGGQLRAGLQLIGFFEDRWGGRDPLGERIDLFAATWSVRPA